MLGITKKGENKISLLLYVNNISSNVTFFTMFLPCIISLCNGSTPYGKFKLTTFKIENVQ
jgi:hypothetical protein